MAKVLEVLPGQWQGTLAIQPSKSLSHRALICAALADGSSQIENLGQSVDLGATRQGLVDLGLAEIRLEQSNLANPWVVGGLHQKQQQVVTQRVVDCKESGSTLRFLLPLALALGIPVKFVGAPTLFIRPMAPFLAALRQGGAQIQENQDSLVVAGRLQAGNYHLPGNISSQYISGLLLALPLLGEKSAVVVDSPLESAAYVALTRQVMAKFGVIVAQQENSFLVDGTPYAPTRYLVEGDWSHGAFPLVAGFLGSEVHCGGLTKESLQGDRQICSVLEALGGQVCWQGDSLQIIGANRSPGVIDVAQIPDLAPVLAIACCGIVGESKLIHAGRLRFKECDRLAATADIIRRLGGQAQVTADCLTIQGQGYLKGGSCSAWNDHRIAMSLAVAATICQKSVFIEGFDAVAKSAPGFWREVKELGGQYYECLLG